MPLNWDLTEIEDYNNLCYLPDGVDPDTGKALFKMHPVTLTIIHLTMVVALPGITEENAREFYFRTAVVEKLLGPNLRQEIDGEFVDRYLTPEDILAHVGLQVNVGKETIAQFRKRIVQGARWDIDRMFDEAVKARAAGEEAA